MQVGVTVSVFWQYFTAPVEVAAAYRHNYSNLQ